MLTSVLPLEEYIEAVQAAVNTPGSGMLSLHLMLYQRNKWAAFVVEEGANRIKYGNRTAYYPTALEALQFLWKETLLPIIRGEVEERLAVSAALSKRYERAKQLMDLLNEKEENDGTGSEVQSK